jgi:YD repeat-containing protein
VVQVVARSSPPWSPSGGLIDADGNLWILEYDAANAQRVRRLDRDGRQRIFPAQATR